MAILLRASAIPASFKTQPMFLPRAGTYTVKLITFTGNNCSDTITKTITVKPIPAVDFTTQSACANNPALFAPAGSGGYHHFRLVLDLWRRRQFECTGTHPYLHFTRNVYRYVDHHRYGRLQQHHLKTYNHRALTQCQFRFQHPDLQGRCGKFHGFQQCG